MHRKAFILLSCVIYLSAPAFASDWSLRIGGGQIHILKDNNTQLYRVDLRFPGFSGFDLRPVFGVWYTGTEDRYIHAGLEKDFPIGSRWAVLIGLSAGAYRDEEGMDLGHTLEFASRIGLSYSFNANHTLEADFGHISNARLSDLNPGTEYATFSYRYSW